MISQFVFFAFAGAAVLSALLVITRKSPVASVMFLIVTFFSLAGMFLVLYAMFHSDRYRNTVIYDPRPGVDGEQGSSLMAHLGYVSGRPDVWYVANGWLYSYRYVAERLVVEVLE